MLFHNLQTKKGNNYKCVTDFGNSPLSLVNFMVIQYSTVRRVLKIPLTPVLRAEAATCARSVQDPGDSTQKMFWWHNYYTPSKLATEGDEMNNQFSTHSSVLFRGSTRFSSATIKNKHTVLFDLDLASTPWKLSEGPKLKFQERSRCMYVTVLQHLSSCANTPPNKSNVHGSHVQLDRSYHNLWVAEGTH
jgi:hypothetical protein